jgi:uncharacterized membrane protein YhaH (DUF805 family)
MLRYFEFNGRSTRQEYWWYTAGSLVAYLGAFWIDYKLGYWQSRAAYGPLLVFAGLFHIVPNLTVSVRRLHDGGRSGWWYFISVVPIIGSFWLLYLVGIKGPDENSDRYGPDPRYPESPQPSPFARRQPQTRAQLMIEQMNARRRSTF